MLSSPTGTPRSGGAAAASPAPVSSSSAARWPMSTGALSTLHRSSSPPAPPVSSVPAPSSAQIAQSSPDGTPTVCTQCWVCKSHRRSVPSLETEARAWSDSERIATPVTAPRCPRSLQRPASATTSHSTSRVSAPPELSRLPSTEKARQSTEPRCPERVTRSAASSISHSRTVPSACPSPRRERSGERQSADTSVLSAGGPQKEWMSPPWRSDHNWAASRAGVSARSPTVATRPSDEATRPQRSSAT
mmetsp:Transcript_10341/g.31753  ORF Transcript_10341/g.31753 Transcript_10341/m.31753 type:complete len:247 (+) Transcript_10341:552-1292(+)|eukprot:scaffold242289_cov31-Tisochrysis_lutea.AAC.7